MLELRVELPENFHDDNRPTEYGTDNLNMFQALLERYGFSNFRVVTDRKNN